MDVKFEWDEKKNISNRKKHGISFETAKMAFDDPFAVACIDRYEDSEERWQTIGLINGMIIILVAHTVRRKGQTDTIRIISARKAIKKERKIYEEQAY